MSEHTNHNLLGRHVVDRPYNRRNVNDQKQSNLPSSTTRICTEFNNISVDTYTENRVLRGDSRFTNHDPVSTREESLKSSEAVSRTSSENTSVDFRINKTIQAVLPPQINFGYLQQQQEIQALKTQGSYCKKVILNRNSKEELQWWIQKLKICNGRYLIQSHSQDASCHGISTGVAIFIGGTVVTLLTLNKRKSLTAVHFQIDNTSALLLYFVKMGGGTGNQMLLILSKEIW